MALYEHDRYYQSTLTFVNYVRGLYGADPLEDLRPGIASKGKFCPIACSLKELGEHVFASHFSVSVNDRQIMYGGGYRGDVPQFVRKFDNGGYPELIWDRNVNHV